MFWAHLRYQLYIGRLYAHHLGDINSSHEDFGAALEMGNDHSPSDCCDMFPTSISPIPAPLPRRES